MKKSEIKALTVEQLVEKIGDTTLSYRRMKFAHGITPLENPLQLRTTRRLIGKLNAELTEKQNAAK